MISSYLGGDQQSWRAPVVAFGDGGLLIVRAVLFGSWALLLGAGCLGCRPVESPPKDPPLDAGEADAGETLIDAGACPGCTSCGDGVCAPQELCRTCEADCGACLSAPLRIEAEDMALLGFVAENVAIASGGKVIQVPSGQATAETSFTAPPDRYRLTVAYFDEDDGKAPVSVELDGAPWEQWRFDEETADASPTLDNFVERPLAAPIQLASGQQVRLVLRGEPQAGDRARFDYVELSPLLYDDPLTAPPNTWVLRHTLAPTKVWESGIAYEPNQRVIVQHGGHALKSYPQSAYTHLYEVASNIFRESSAPDRPQRRCLVETAYLDSVERIVSAHGASGHGSWPEGRLQGDGTRVDFGDPRGPWMYDAAADRWTDQRTLLPEWNRIPHAQLAYEPSSDALVSITGGSLTVYNPRQNRIYTRSLPPELVDRKSYAIAADPVERRIVVFGGTGPAGWTWVGRDQAAYDSYVHADTWLYDPVANQWEQVAAPVHPPRGMPLENHIRLPMVYHPPSGLVLLLQTPLDRPELNRLLWPKTELWAFDVAARTWQRLDTFDPPRFGGLLAYAEEEDLLVLFGGGRDAARPSQSHHVYATRVQVPGRELRPAPQPKKVGLSVLADRIELDWPSEPGARYRVHRAEANPFAGVYVELTPEPLEGGHFVDSTAVANKDYAYQLERVGRVRRSLPAFTRPLAPGAPLVSVEAADRVVLTWPPSGASAVAGYHVYREVGPLSSGQVRLTGAPISSPTFVDSTTALGDGIIRSYYVTAVDVRGRESGASPRSFSVPEAPTKVDAKVLAPGRTRLTWEPSKDPFVAGVNVYFTGYHLNTHEKPVAEVDAWKQSWTKINAAPLAGGELVFDTPSASAGAAHLYFLLRAVGPLGKEGFWTDILSATDERFRPAVGP